MVETRLIGFDARVLDFDAADLWSPSRREAFLLRPDSPLPVSVDVMSWPSLFDYGQGAGMPDAERRRLHLAGITPPPWIGPNAVLWENLESMRQCLAQSATSTDKRHEIAVTWVSATGFAAGPYGPHAEPTVPPELHPAWRFLGYDIADGSQCSGLSNCGYTEQELPALRLEWSPLLNQSHLLADCAAALRFRDLTDARVPEHAPFFVYGLYLITE